MTPDDARSPGDKAPSPGALARADTMPVVSAGARDPECAVGAAGSARDHRGHAAMADAVTLRGSDSALTPDNYPTEVSRSQAIEETIRFAAGTVLGERYEILEHLGSGGMGAVYSGHDRLVDQDVALKFVHPALADEPAMMRALSHEVRLTQKVTHINVARTFTLEEIDGYLFIVMELLRGNTLQEALKGGPLAVERALAIARDLLAGLQAAHGRSVIHRDIKPANIKLCDDGRVVLMDFGLARPHEVATVWGQTVSGPVSKTHTALGGTPGYIAPEVVRGKGAGVRADLYAFGVVLFEMLAGRPPFEADSALKLIDKHADEEAPDLTRLCKNVPARVAQAVKRLMAKDPAKRFASAAEVQAALDPPGPVSITMEVPRQPAAGRPLRLALAGLVVAGAAVGFLLWRHQASWPEPGARPSVGPTTPTRALATPATTTHEITGPALPAPGSAGLPAPAKAAVEPVSASGTSESTAPPPPSRVPHAGVSKAAPAAAEAPATAAPAPERAEDEAAKKRWRMLKLEE
jgi:serine/threonine-protein kinase